MAITAYVVAAALVVVASFWAARSGRADAASGPTPTASASAPSAGTPRITITLTPAWQSPASPDITASSTLSSGSMSLAEPYVLAGSAATGYARLDPTDGSWIWRRDTQGQPLLGWAGSTALFGEAVSSASPGAGRGVFGVTAAGVRSFASHAGGYVTSTSNRILLLDGRDLTALTASGRVAWRTRLPAGVTQPGHVAGLAGPGGIPLTPTDVVFVSRSGPGRISTVELADGALHTRSVPVADPEAWASGWGPVVWDPARGAIFRYDTGGKLAWTVDDGGLTLLDVDGSLALVADASARTVSLLRLQDGTTVWSSYALDNPVAGATLTTTEAGPVLLELRSAGGAAPVVMSVDLINGELRWVLEDRQMLGTWRGYVLLSDPNRNELSARSLLTGDPSATLNTSATLTPDGTDVLDGVLVYLAPGTGTAHAVAMATG